MRSSNAPAAADAEGGLPCSLRLRGHETAKIRIKEEKSWI
jgi:hypothetical protein